MKNLMSVVLTLCMFIGIVAAAPVQISAVVTNIQSLGDTYTSGDYKYALCDDGTAKICGYTGKDAKLIIPSTIEGYTVTTIDNGTFKDCTNLKSITIPNSVTSIDDDVFVGCASLKSITIPNSVTSIGSYAFWDCTNLTNITISKSVTSIDSGVFYGCKNLKSITVPNGVRSIGDYAFFGCTNLTSITIPKSVTSINSHAFEGCTNLKNVYYMGNNAQWKNIKISADNDCLTKYATINDLKTTISLKSSKAIIYIKGKIKIRATVKNGEGKTTFKSSNAKIAKVNGSGVVTGVKVGTTKITVANGGAKKTFTVTVKKPKLNKKNVTLKKKQSITLTITGRVGKAAFKSSNKKIAVVNRKGKITAKKKGSATITVKTNGIKLKCKVTVK